jgi:hypothetical protein
MLPWLYAAAEADACSKTWYEEETSPKCGTSISYANKVSQYDRPQVNQGAASLAASA